MKYIINFLKGMAVGIATLVPGVSGGTMAIILNIYDELLHAVGSYFENWKKHTVFLMVIGLGGLTGIALFSRLLDSALANYPFVMRFLFMGIILGGLPVLYRKSAASGKIGISSILLFLAGFIIVIFAGAEPEATASMATSQGWMSYIFLFIAGIILAVALVLPGISGSFMLLALGLYGVFLSALNERNIPFLISLGLGVAAGTMGTTRIIEKFLQKYPGKAYMLIMGFVVGSLIPVYPGIPAGSQLLASAAAAIIGFLFILWLGKKDIAD